MIDFIRSFCWQNRPSFFNCMINIFIFRCVDTKTLDYYYFADLLTWNNSLNNKKLNSVAYVFRRKLLRVGWISDFWLLNDTHFLWLDPLAGLVNNPINIFLVITSIILYYLFSIKYLWISIILLVSIIL